MIKITIARGLYILTLVIFTGNASLAERLSHHPYKSTAKVHSQIPNLTSLNIRMSHQSTQVPQKMLKESLVLPEVRAARSMIAPSPRSAILEDDNHNRVVILLASKEGEVQAQILEDIDFETKIPFIVACADQRGCAFDRQPVTGGLACVAICVQQALNPEHKLTP